MRAATSGVICSPAWAKTSPACMRDPTGRVPAKRLEGAASISTYCSSGDTFTCSMTIAVSNPSGIATPVLAKSQFTPRVQADVSGIFPSSKSSYRTAMESSAQVRAFGASSCASTSRASTRPAALATAIRSTRKDDSPGLPTTSANPLASSIRRTASSRVSSIWLE